MAQTDFCDIAIVGGGPAGLVLAYALQKTMPDAIVKVGLRDMLFQVFLCD